MANLWIKNDHSDIRNSTKYLTQSDSILLLLLLLLLLLYCLVSDHPNRNSLKYEPRGTTGEQTIPTTADGRTERKRNRGNYLETI